MVRQAPGSALLAVLALAASGCLQPNTSGTTTGTDANAELDGGVPPASDVLDVALAPLWTLPATCEPAAAGTRSSAPIELIIVRDRSASTHCTDRFFKVSDASLDLACRALESADVNVGLVSYASDVLTVPLGRSFDALQEALAPIVEVGPATDTEHALDVATDLVRLDLDTSSSEELAATHVVVVLVTDGRPEPQCRQGCDDGDTPPDQLYAVCNLDTGPDLPERFQGCPERNSPASIVAAVDRLRALRQTYGLADVAVHVRFAAGNEDPCGLGPAIQDEALAFYLPLASTFDSLEVVTELDEVYASLPLGPL